MWKLLECPQRPEKSSGPFGIGSIAEKPWLYVATAIARQNGAGSSEAIYSHYSWRMQHTNGTQTSRRFIFPCTPYGTLFVQTAVGLFVKSCSKARLCSSHVIPCCLLLRWVTDLKSVCGYPQLGGLSLNLGQGGRGSHTTHTMW